MRIIDFLRVIPDGWVARNMPDPVMEFEVVEEILHPETQSELVSKYEKLTPELLNRMAEAGADEVEVLDTFSGVRYRAVLDLDPNSALASDQITLGDSQSTDLAGFLRDCV